MLDVILQEKVSRFGWWDGLQPVTPAPYKDEDVEDAEKEKAKELKKKKEFIERMKKQKLEREMEAKTKQLEETSLSENKTENTTADNESLGLLEVVNENLAP